MCARILYMRQINNMVSIAIQSEQHILCFDLMWVHVLHRCGTHSAVCVGVCLCLYSRIICELQRSNNVTAGPVMVTVGSSEPGQSQQTFTYQDPVLIHIVPSKGPMAGGTRLTVHGAQLLTGQDTDLRAFVGSQPCHM